MLAECGPFVFISAATAATQSALLIADVCNAADASVSRYCIISAATAGAMILQMQNHAIHALHVLVHFVHASFAMLRITICKQIVTIALYAAGLRTVCVS